MGVPLRSTEAAFRRILLPAGLLLVASLLLLAASQTRVRLMEVPESGLSGKPGAVLLQDATTTPTETHTATASSTATITATQTVTGMPTVTGSATLSVTPTTTGTETSTPTVTSTGGATPSVPPTATGTGTPPADATPVIVETNVITATATLAPLPAITYQFPAVTATDSLLTIEHRPGLSPISKQGTTESGVWASLVRFWPLGLLLMVWLGLAVWFVISQRF